MSPREVPCIVFSKVSVLSVALSFASPRVCAADGKPHRLTGQAAFTDAAHESPGTRRHLTVADLPAPAPDQSVDNGPSVVPRPANAWPMRPRASRSTFTPPASTIPRLLRTAPNGDIFLAESETGKIKVFRGVGADGKPQQTSVFAEGLHQPFGIAFYPLGPNPQYVYIGDTDEIVRFPYKNGDLKASGKMEHLAELPGGGRLRGGGHWTRDLVFSKDGNKLFASVGSHSNVDDSDTHPEEFHRADVLEFTPTGKFVKVYACGHPQLRRRGHQPHHRRALVLHQRARRAGQQPRARLRDPRAGGRLLRLAVVLHGPPRRLRTRATRASIPSCSPRSSRPTSWSTRTSLRSR